MTIESDKIFVARDGAREVRPVEGNSGRNSAELIGITGGIASGKSSFGKYLVDRGLTVFDTDSIYHGLLKSDMSLRKELVGLAGEDIVVGDGIDTRLLGERVFGSPPMLAKLNEITHPRILNALFKKVALVIGNNPIFIQVPLLFESHLEGFFGRTILVYVNRETQLRRLMERDGIDRRVAEMKLSSQMPLDRKVPRADFVVTNHGTIDELRVKAPMVIARIARK